MGTSCCLLLEHYSSSLVKNINYQISTGWTRSQMIHVGRLLVSILCLLINCISAEPPPTFSSVTVKKRHSNPDVFVELGLWNTIGGIFLCYQFKNYWTHISTHNKLSSAWREMTAVISHFMAVAILLFSFLSAGDKWQGQCDDYSTPMSQREKVLTFSTVTVVLLSTS